VKEEPKEVLLGCLVSLGLLVLSSAGIAIAIAFVPVFIMMFWNGFIIGLLKVDLPFLSFWWALFLWSFIVLVISPLFNKVLGRA